MKKAILIGNGFTANLIKDYKDEYMIKKFKEHDESLYKEIDDMLTPYRSLKNKDELNIIELLKKEGIAHHHYYRYFVEQNLISELSKPHITAIETLLKVASLFHHVQEFNVPKIETIANQIYFNNGKNGINSITTNIDLEKMKEYINSFDYVFTTNFDNILDELFASEVFHLHGGFYYEKIQCCGTISIVKNHSRLPYNRACLIWGCNHERKTTSMTGGATSPFSFPLAFGPSILTEYIKFLRNNDFDTIHILGYSGLNDGHINECIKNNNNIKNVIVYVDPIYSDNIEEKKKLEKLYVFSNDTNLEIKSWNLFWELFLYE